MYAKVFDNQIVQYPYSIAELRLDFPNTSFAIPLSLADLAEFGIVEVAQAEPPEYNPLTHTVSEGQPALVNGVWTQQWELQEKDLAQIKVELAALATEHRWLIETGGLTLPNGVEIKTGTDDQTRITSVIANARLAGVTSVDFKAANGWITLSITEIESIAAAVALHVQACFAAERAHHETINSSDYPDLLGYDVEKFWPSNLMA